VNKHSSLFSPFVKTGIVLMMSSGLINSLKIRKIAQILITCPIARQGADVTKIFTAVSYEFL
jgi:hypothetical protein